MKGTFKAVRVTDRIWRVGAIDWKVTLVDTVKHGFSEEMAARIAPARSASRATWPSSCRRSCSTPTGTAAWWRTSPT